MKKNIFFIIALCLFLLPLFSLERQTFLSSGVNVNASSEQDTTSTSEKVWLSKGDKAEDASIQITFTRTAGSESALDFEFQFSLDGTNWDTDNSFKISVPTDTVADSNVVRKTVEINIDKVPFVRLSKIKNNDSVNNVTNCNATISF